MIKLAPEDVVKIPELLGVSNGAVTAGLSKIGDIARTKWVTLAMQRLNTSQRDYVAAISNPVLSVDDKGNPQVTLTLRGKFPNMVETGADPFDLRATLLNPSLPKKPGTVGIRRSKKGYLYRAIPFRRMGPSASGKNAAALGAAESQAGRGAMSLAFRGERTAEEARLLGRAVAREAKKLEPTVGMPGGKVQYGGRLAKGVGGAMPLRPRHKTDLYEGTVREEKTYAKATQSQLMTFRMISTNPGSFREDDAGGSPQMNWIHPGILARNLAPATSAYVDMVLQRKWLGNL